MSLYSNNKTIRNSSNHSNTVLRKYRKAETELPASISTVINIASEKRVEEIRERANTDGLQFFAEVCLKNVVKKRDWRLNHRKEVLQKFVTVADEALALLVLENNVEIWLQLANNDRIEAKEQSDDTKEDETGNENDSITTDETKSVTVYTSGGVKSDGTKRGWSREGIKRYNELYRKVKSIRAKSENRGAEEELRVRWRNTQIGDGEADIIEIEDTDSFEEALNDFDYDNLMMV